MAPAADPAAAVRRALQGSARAVLVTVKEVRGTPPSRPGMSLAWTDDGTLYGSLGCDGFDRSAERDARTAIETGRRTTSTYEWEEGSEITVEVEPFFPGDRFEPSASEILEILVVGTGPVARSLVALGEAMGYHVRVAAGPRSPSVGEFDGADEVIVTPTVHDVEALRPGPSTYVVICGHDEEFSIPVMRALLSTDVPYLGMMGSRRHTGHLIDELRSQGFDDERLSRLHTPVGLDIGSETPEEIAISVLAQIVAVRRAGDKS